MCQYIALLLSCLSPIKTEALYEHTSHFMKLKYRSDVCSKVVLIFSLVEKTHSLCLYESVFIVRENCRKYCYLLSYKSFIISQKAFC